MITTGLNMALGLTTISNPDLLALLTNLLVPFTLFNFLLLQQLPVVLDLCNETAFLTPKAIPTPAEATPTTAIATLTFLFT